MKALIVVDMQNDFIKPTGALPVSGAESIVKNINTLIREFERMGDSVIYTRDTHDINDPEFKDFPPHCVKGTPGAEIYDGLVSEATGSILIDKTTLDPYSNPYLLDFLKDHGIREIYICGVATEYCVKFAIDGSLEHGFSVVVPTDAIKGLSNEDSDRIIKAYGSTILLYKIGNDK